MPEGLSPQEVGKEIAEHAKHSGQTTPRTPRPSCLDRRGRPPVDRRSAGGLVRLRGVQMEHRVPRGLAKASAARTEANRANLEAIELRNFDSSTFEAWFAAYTAHNKPAMALAEHRFRPEFRVAFDAWRATSPETNPNAPRGPTYMPQYRQPGLREGGSAGQPGGRRLRFGGSAGETADKYVRVTVFLASVLFIVGISTHFPLRVRYGLVALGGVMLVLSLVQLTQLPGLPA